jgi:hypothetical protein
MLWRLPTFLIRLVPSRDFNITDVTGMGNRYARRRDVHILSLRLKIEGEKFIVRFQTLHMTKRARINTVLSKYDDVSVPGFCLLTDGDSIYPPFLFPNRLNSRRGLS